MQCKVHLKIIFKLNYEYTVLDEKKHEDLVINTNDQLGGSQSDLTLSDSYISLLMRLLHKGMLNLKKTCH